MLKKIKSTIIEYSMIENDNPIIVGVSGGADSMVLLEILSKTVTNKLIVAHLNHKFRGEEANKDAEFVKNESEKRGITSIIKEIDVPAYMEENNIGAEIAAREVRYQFYEEVAREWNATIIALGHHIDDQAETVLFRLIRGTGVNGISGIPYSRDLNGIKIIRPLLDVRRKEIEEYCYNNAITYITDQSNFSTMYFRNKIRLNVIPFLEEYNVKITQHLHQLAKVTQAENRYFNELADEFIQKNSIIGESECKLEIKKLKSIDISLQRRVIYLILKYLKLSNDITSSHIEDILSLANQSHPSKSINLPGIRAYREYDKIIFDNNKQIGKIEYSYKLEIERDTQIPEVNKKIRLLIKDKYEEFDGISAVFDYELIEEKNIIVRSRKDGDKIELPGVNGSKKIKDIFIDLKIPLTNRYKFPIIETDDNIIWLAGIRRSKHAYISKKTKKFLYIIILDK